MIIAGISLRKSIFQVAPKSFFDWNYSELKVSRISDICSCKTAHSFLRKRRRFILEQAYSRMVFLKEEYSLSKPEGSERLQYGADSCTWNRQALLDRWGIHRAKRNRGRFRLSPEGRKPESTLSAILSFLGHPEKHGFLNPRWPFLSRNIRW